MNITIHSLTRKCSKPYAVSFYIMVAIVLLLNSPAGKWLESSMIGHVLIELPLLVFLGIYLVSRHKINENKTIQSVLQLVNRGGIFGLITAAFALAFWMIPRWLDSSISQIYIANIKYISMIFIGICLALSWPKTHILTRAVVKIELLTMLFRLGWIYSISPMRLCNNYLLNEQVWLGQGLLILAVSLSCYWIIGLFIGEPRENKLCY